MMMMTFILIKISWLHNSATALYAVSYTHLDVYKRQLYHSFRLIGVFLYTRLYTPYGIGVTQSNYQFIVVLLNHSLSSFLLDLTERCMFLALYYSSPFLVFGLYYFNCSLHCQHCTSHMICLSFVQLLAYYFWFTHFLENFTLKLLNIFYLC